MASDTQLADLQLVEAIQRGDSAALARFYDQNQRLAMAIAFRIVQDRDAAEEVIQEAFLAVWRRATTYRPDYGSVRSWFLKIVQNRSIDYVRAHRSERGNVPFDPTFTVGDSQGVFPAVATLLDRTEIKNALAGLPAEQKDAIEMAYFSGYTAREIGDLTSTPVGTIKSRMRLGLNRLRDLLRPAVFDMADP